MAVAALCTALYDGLCIEGSESWRTTASRLRVQNITIGELESVPKDGELHTW